MFPNACHEAKELDTAGKNALNETIRAHLSKLQDRFNDYFPEKHGDDDWVRDPFGVEMESVTLPSNEESQLVELSCDRSLKKKFTESGRAVSRGKWARGEEVLTPVEPKQTKPCSGNTAANSR
ncbi:Zinc finger BED domain containing protein 5 [Dissostichus eleginoides]|uniref:Zinc finger BED domain containing protein 5 n=1 Tax=Dissostichus eleginoides TaxID=100907 RepID=A0AAD9BZA0_DISEL|nr:Zinc finger BED domain containing protein 5 [Dissostichus eleginoides]